ncbi:MAG: hypothetical protein M3R05_01985 [Chloroflexota bacterium]|nr:hypothetical protein [Chloroflexota bacterium]
MKRPTILVTATALLAVLSACGGTGTTQTTATPKPTPGSSTVAVTLTEFAIALDHATAAAGPITFRVTNTGSIEHEFVVLKTDLAPSVLPGGSKVPEDAAGITIVDEVEGMASGAKADLKVTLQPGHYVLLCNIEGHNMGGMHAAFEVSS